jgi:hypothetical protein
VRSDRILQRYNTYHNLETSGLPHGTPITPEQQQMIAFRSMIDAFKCDHLNQEYTHIAIDDIEDLIEGLYQQSIAFLENHHNTTKILLNYFKEKPPWED